MRLQWRVNSISTAKLRNEYQPCCKQEKTTVQISQALRNATDSAKTLKPTLWAAGSYQGTRVVFVLKRRAVTPEKLRENRKNLAVELCQGLKFSA